MPELAVKEVTHFEVDAFALESFIEEITGHQINIPALEESGNDTTLDYRVTGELLSYEAKDINSWLDSGNESHIQYQVGSVLNWLAREGHIKTGNYLVPVCW